MSSEHRGTVLIVEDQEPVARAIAILLSLDGVTPVTAAGPAEALAVIGRGAVDAVVQDMNFTPGETSGREGVELFCAIRELEPGMPVLLVTAWGSLETAVRLMKDGAADYVEKPWDDERLLEAVRAMLGGGRRPGAAAAGPEDLGGLVVESTAMRAVVELALKVARADVPVLITGPNGTGKERLAELVHRASSRRDRPLVKVNAGALPETLVEAELFGAEPGAFTGAESRRVGRFEAADGGTLLLDEIATLPAAGQAKLLRVLQTGEFERLGSSTTRRADVRVIAATNADLERAIAAGEFREDLYFRLNVVELRLPPLADRPEDILPLAEHFLDQLSPSPDGVVRRLGRSAREALLEHRWPGNVRELRNRVQRATLVAAGMVIEPEDLGFAPGAAPLRPADDLDPEELVQRRAVEAALERAGGVVAQAAAELGISRQALYRRMARLGVEIERRPRSG